MNRMNRWVLLGIFSLLAIAAASLGFIGLNSGAGSGRVVIFIFLGVCVVLLIWGIWFGRKPPPVPPNPPLPPV